MFRDMVPTTCSNCRSALRTKVKSSMQHHNLEQYVLPATTSSVWQPARKTGKQASDCSMLPWSMHALSCGTRRGARILRYRACMHAVGRVQR